MEKSGNAWECECGNIEFGKYPPEECPKCCEINGFNLINEERLTELEDDVLEKIRNSDIEDENDGEDFYEN